MTNEYEPDWVSPPGDTIRDALEESNCPLSRPQMTDAQFEDLLSGKLEIDDSLAQALSDLYGPTKDFWINRERQYREYLKKLQVKMDGIWRTHMVCCGICGNKRCPHVNGHECTNSNEPGQKGSDYE